MADANGEAKKARRKRKRRRWGDEEEIPDAPPPADVALGIPVVSPGVALPSHLGLPPGATPVFVKGVPQLPSTTTNHLAFAADHAALLAKKARVEDISRKILLGDFDSEFAKGEVAAIPGTASALLDRTQRMKKKLEKERTMLIEVLKLRMPGYTPPASAMKKERIHHKVYLHPDNLYREINIKGAIIGQRGSVHRQLETDTGCRIVVAGIGAGPSRRGGTDDNDEIHCLISAEEEELLMKGVRAVQSVIDYALTSQGLPRRFGADGSEEHRPAKKPRLAPQRPTFGSQQGAAPALPLPMQPPRTRDASGGELTTHRWKDAVFGSTTPDMERKYEKFMSGF